VDLKAKDSMEHQNLRISIGENTCSMGTEEFNVALTDRRAPNGMHYLLKKGVQIERIKTIVLGETKPIQPNQTSAGKDYPEGRAKKRRAGIQEVSTP
jgi:outer membrane protein OmpA-like peptidoglycan-associated protein